MTEGLTVTSLRNRTTVFKYSTSSAGVHSYWDYLTFWIFAPEYLMHFLQGSYIRGLQRWKRKPPVFRANGIRKRIAYLLHFSQPFIGVQHQRNTCKCKKSHCVSVHLKCRWVISVIYSIQLSLRDARETQSCAIMRNNIPGGYLLQEDAAAVNVIKELA